MKKYFVIVGTLVSLAAFGSNLDNLDGLLEHENIYGNFTESEILQSSNGIAEFSGSALVKGNLNLKTDWGESLLKSGTVYIKIRSRNWNVLANWRKDLLLVLTQIDSDGSETNFKFWLPKSLIKEDGSASVSMASAGQNAHIVIEKKENQSLPFTLIHKTSCELPGLNVCMTCRPADNSSKCGPAYSYHCKGLKEAYYNTVKREQYLNVTIFDSSGNSATIQTNIKTGRKRTFMSFTENSSCKQY
jgi:hypothetical protein